MDEAVAGPLGPFGLGSVINLRRGGYFRRPGSVPLGLTLAETARHTLVVGPTGKGKTESLIVPWAYEAMRSGASVVVLDGQGRLALKIERYAAYRGATGTDVAFWNYKEPNNSVSWNWVADSADDDRRTAAVTAILGPSTRSSSSTADPFFWDNDAEILGCLLAFASHASARPVTAHDLVMALSSQAILQDLLYGRTGAPGAHRLESLVGLDPVEFDRRTSGTRTALAGLDTEAVCRVTSSPDLDLNRQLSSNGLLVVSTPLQGGETSARLASLMMGSILQRASERFLASGPTRPIFIIVDETSQIAGRVALDVAVSQLRAASVSLVLGIQSLAQLETEKLRPAVLGNTATKVIMSGTSDETARYFAGALGTRPQTQSTLNRGETERSFSFATEQVPTVGQREIQRLWGGDPAALVLLDHRGRSQAPILTDLHRPDL